MLSGSKTNKQTKTKTPQEISKDNAVENTSPLPTVLPIINHLLYLPPAMCYIKNTIKFLSFPIFNVRSKVFQFSDNIQCQRVS